MEAREIDFTAFDEMKNYTYSQNAMEYKEECDKFSKLGEHLSKIVYSSNARVCLEWKEKRHHFYNWIASNNLKI